MRQARAVTGPEFERQIQKETNFREPKEFGIRKMPHTEWTVKGKNFIEKIQNSNFDPSKFEIIENKSFHYKADLIKVENDQPRKVDCKRHNILKEKFLMAEWILSVKTGRHLEQMVEIWNVPLHVAVKMYNKFITEFFNTRKDIFTYMINQMKKNSDYLMGKERILVPIEEFDIVPELVSGKFHKQPLKRIKFMAKRKEKSNV